MEFSVDEFENALYEYNMDLYAKHFNAFLNYIEKIYINSNEANKISIHNNLIVLLKAYEYKDYLRTFEIIKYRFMKVIDEN